MRQIYIPIFFASDSIYSHVYEKRFNRVFKVSSFNNSGTWTINLEIFFASSDSNLYNSIATAIDPDASSSCIAKLPTYLLACPPRDQKRFRTHTNIFSTKFQFHEK